MLASRSTEGLSTDEVLLLVLQSQEDVLRQVAAFKRTIADQTKEFDRLRTRVTDPNREELTAAQAADELGISPYTVREHAKRSASGEQGFLRGFRVPGRGPNGEWRFKRADVEYFRSSRRR